MNIAEIKAEGVRRALRGAAKEQMNHAVTAVKKAESAMENHPHGAAFYTHAEEAKRAIENALTVFRELQSVIP